MAAPNLKLQVEPRESGKSLYLPLAATTANGDTGVKIVLRLRMENKEATTVRVKGIRFSFPGSTHPAKDMQGVNMDNSLDLDKDEVAFWCNGNVDIDPNPDVENTVNNAVYLTGAAPPLVKVEVTCKNFSHPVNLTLPLAPHQSPVPEEAYRFPYAAGELRDDEYYSTSAVHWADGGAKGVQIFAHDIGCVGWDNQTNSWSSRLPGGDISKNEDYRIWNKPVRAVADGIVEDFHDGMDDNTITLDANGDLKFPSPVPEPSGGNHFFIRHGTEVVKYSHLRKGSIPAELKQIGAKVSEGQLIGRVGNTGKSSNPHTHIHCVRASDDALRPIPFRSAWVINRDELSPPSANGPWFRLKGHGIPKDKVAIWPASTSPGFPIPTVGISMEGDWANSFYIRPDFESFKQQAQELADEHGRRLIRLTTFLEKGQRRWVGISRAGNWANRWWVSPDLASFKTEVQKLFDEKGLRLIYVDSFTEGNERKWIGIARGGDWATRLTIRDDLASFTGAVQKVTDDEGMRVIYIMTWAEGGKRKWLGISRSGNWANRWWVSQNLDEFSAKSQKLADEEGRRLIHITSYVEGNQRKWIGISRAGDWANRWYLRPDLDSFRLESQRLADDKHMRLIHVDML